MQKASTQHKLQTLFTEVTALAHQLRTTSAKSYGADVCPQGALNLLRVLDQQGPQAVPAIARARGLSRQNIQVLVNRLLAGGLVTLGQNPAHKRSALVHLTDRAREFLTAASRQETRNMEALLPYITESRLVPAATLLRQLRQLLGGVQQPEQTLPRRVPAPPSTAPARKRVRRKQPSPALTEAPPSESGEPEEKEFPVNLL